MAEYARRQRDGKEVPKLRLLLRPSGKNKRLAKQWESLPGIEILWGDLTSPDDLRLGVEGCRMVLHVGGMVSPAADYFPEKTRRVNVGGIENIISAVRALPDPQSCPVVFIGSVAQYGPREGKGDWVDASTPQVGARFDHYAASKIDAEKLLRESGLKWASLRLGSILSADLLMKGTDPITFHVPLEGVLEWTTDGDCGRLLCNLAAGDPDAARHRDGNHAEDSRGDLEAGGSTDCPGVGDSFWNRAYNIGSGGTFRLTYYDFECRLLKAIGCPPPEKIFRRNWFATGNFHGAWFLDSDLLEDWLHFRGQDDVDAHFRKMSVSLPSYFRLARFVPPFLIRVGMRAVASKWPFGPLSWLRKMNDQKSSVEERELAREKVDAYFGGLEEWRKIGGWEEWSGK